MCPIDTETAESIRQETSQIRQLVEARIEEGTKPLREENERLQRAVREIQQRANDAERRSLVTGSAGQGRQLIQSGKYAGRDRLDLAMIRSLCAAQVAETPAANAALEFWRASIAAAMDSVTSGTGDELVPTGEAAQLWMDVNLESMILPLFVRIPMPTNPFDIPLQLGDVNFYPGTENVATKSTAAATAKKTLTAYELMAEVPWSYDLDEDAVIAMMDELRDALRRNTAEVIDDVLLNADTTALNNINADGTTIAAPDAGKGQWLLGFDGLRHLAIIDATGQGNSEGAVVDDAMFIDNLQLLGKYGVRPSEVVHVMDISTYLSSLEISNFRTLDKLGPNATLLTGQLGSVGNVPDGAAGTVGGLLTFNRTQWRTGFRREIAFETVRDPQKRPCNTTSPSSGGRPPGKRKRELRRSATDGSLLRNRQDEPRSRGRREVARRSRFRHRLRPDVPDEDRARVGSRGRVRGGAAEPVWNRPDHQARDLDITTAGGTASSLGNLDVVTLSGTCTWSAYPRSNTSGKEARALGSPGIPHDFLSRSEGSKWPKHSKTSSTKRYRPTPERTTLAWSRWPRSRTPTRSDPSSY